MRQGMHQSAQKSTSTGCSDWRTSVSKLESLNSTTFLLAAIGKSPRGQGMIGMGKRGVNEGGRALGTRRIRGIGREWRAGRTHIWGRSPESLGGGDGG